MLKQFQNQITLSVLCTHILLSLIYKLGVSTRENFLKKRKKGLPVLIFKKILNLITIGTILLILFDIYRVQNYY